MKEFKLDKEPKINSGFTTPEAYFDSFSESVLKQEENGIMPWLLYLF